MLCPRALHALCDIGHEYCAFGLRGAGYESPCCGGLVDLDDQHVRANARATMGRGAISGEVEATLGETSGT